MASPQPVRSDQRRVRAVRLCAPEVAVDRKPDGTLYLKSSRTLPDYPDRLTDRLVHWAAVAPDRVFMAERGPGGAWRTLTYARTLDKVRRIGAALLTRDLSAERPIVILSGNDLEHALLGLAANYVGIPYAPVSPAYSLISSDFGKLRHIVNLLTARPRVRLRRRAVRARHRGGRAAGCGNGRRAQPAAQSADERLLSELDAAADARRRGAPAKVGPDTIAKFLFTSGSTGMPKGVINTQRMWCANQAMIATALQFFVDEPPVIVDWAPWHHTAGGNHDVGLVIHNGGTMYIDGGKPLPGRDRRDGAQPARDRAHLVLHGAEGLRGAAAVLPRRRGAAREFLLPAEGAVVRRSRPRAARVRRVEGHGIPHVPRGHSVLTGLGSTETAPYAFGRMWDTANADQCRPAAARSHREARAARRQIRGAAEGAEHHARLLA
jgi:feruloyl-CoA synthase